MESLTPNEWAKKLDQIAKASYPDTSGLTEAQAAYVLAVRDILTRYKARKICKEQAEAERRDYQRKYLQPSLLQEMINLWAT